MFSSKSLKRSWGWVVVDLSVVVIGVYIAFLIQSKALERKDQREKVKIYSALKMELEAFRVGFPEFAIGNQSFLEEVRDKDTYDISNWRFIEPQYGYQIVEYALNIGNTDIIDFETYEELKNLVVMIKQLEHSERLLTKVAGEYQFLIPELPESHPMNLERKANNKLKLFRFKMFLGTRIGGLERIAEKAKGLLAQVNEFLGPDITDEINRKYIAQLFGWLGDYEDVVDLVQERFPEYSEEDLKEMYLQATAENENE
ncbi:MAG: hypothetical protein AAF616_13090 [Bacteroidota bacterium]